MREKIERTGNPVSRLLHALQERLEALRVDAHLTRDEFAKSLGIPRSSYFYLMSAAANPTLEYVEQIARSAGVDPCALLCAQPLPETSDAPGTVNAKAETAGEQTGMRLRSGEV